MPEQENKATAGLSTILFIIFLTLKLSDVKPVADWSWLWILSPLWIPVALVSLAILIVFLVTYFTK